MKNVEHYRKLLTARRDELMRRLGKIGRDLEQTPDPDFEERAIQMENDEVLEDLGAAGMAELRQIEAALKRIEDGEYGICLRCGDEIAPERLEVVPQAPLCADCAAKL